MIVSNHWQCRLGNNIIQLCNIIDIALFYKHSIIFKVNHTYFNLKVITDYFRKYKDNTINKKKILTDKRNFFRAAIDGSYPKKVFEKIRI